MNKNRLLILLLIGALIITVLVCLLKMKHFAAETLHLKQATIFTLPVGTGGADLQQLLYEQHLMQHTGWLPWLMAFEPKLVKIKAGTYLLKPGLTVRGLLALLVSGKETQFYIRFIEGSTLKEWLSVLSHAPYLQHDLQGVTQQMLAAKLGVPADSVLEGYFYPDTYLYTANTLDSMILKRTRQCMAKILASIWQGRADGLPYKDPQALLTMASIIEKETGINKERARVASVFINRLRIGMKLQTDPTVIYGLGDDYRGIITRHDLTKLTPYNTYIISGLPPTPIAMPGQASLIAAAHPEKSDYLYFVADGSGGHVFTTNLVSHNQAVLQYRQL
ncbi:endolytic transglycosylase MltG [Candidatus Hoaglandella endobia]|uniref:Endolytic murein transglycosylase n=1 Tax=Candidatus Hoaglandella endobia TaxID=1778263 RepID=A0A143WTY1_9ENTR|nr:endolytic transglycosylase MltG [Candidatus Hoaglandella endobia]CUX97213.1 putative aminodeoxychorismate lyase [Candidatus Hoaglandella endobia]